jgi:hypothetical protein
MPQAKRKKRTSTPRGKEPTDNPPLNPLRAGMPAQDSIIGVEEFKKGKKVYRIIHTNEVDEYEQPLPKTKARCHTSHVRKFRCRLSQRSHAHEI